MVEIFTDPFIVAVGTFLLGAVALAVVIATTSTRRWHDRHHQTRSELMCDHCRERRQTNPESAPRMRVLGERRW